MCQDIPEKFLKILGIVPRKFPEIGSEELFFRYNQEFSQIWSIFSLELVTRNSLEFVTRSSLDRVLKTPRNGLKEIPQNWLQEIPRNRLREISRNGSQEIFSEWGRRNSSELVLIYSKEIITRESPAQTKP